MRHTFLFLPFPQRLKKDEGIHSRNLREIALLRFLSHPNIIAAREIITDSKPDPDQYIVYTEHCKTDLSTLMYRSKEYLSPQRQRVSNMSLINYRYTVYAVLRSFPKNEIVTSSSTLFPCFYFMIFRSSTC